MCTDARVCFLQAQVDSVKYDQSRSAMSKRIYVVHSRVKFGYRCGAPQACAAKAPLQFLPTSLDNEALGQSNPARGGPAVL